MPWHAQLQLDYRRDHARTVVHHQHNGPLRVLQSLYPEGDTVCHNILVHPPGGLVGGDTLDIAVQVAPGAHALVTTPGATRFYRSSGEAALQRTQAVVAEDARLEWLPLESICYNGCQAENHLRLDVAPGGECLGWDVTTLGLQHAQQPFEHGVFTQHMEVPGIWLERGRLDASDRLLMDSPLGLAGQRCMASLFFVAGTELSRTRRELAQDTARAVVDAHTLATTAGVTSPNPRMVVLRLLAPGVEPAMQLLQQVWAAWREALWNLPAQKPRIWAV